MLHKYHIQFSNYLKQKFNIRDAYLSDETPKGALEKYLEKKYKNYKLKRIDILNGNNSLNANVIVKFSEGKNNYYFIVIEKREKSMEMNKRYKWADIVEEYPNKIAIVSDIEVIDGVVDSCNLLEITSKEGLIKTIKKYKKSNIKNWGYFKTTFSAPNVGVLC